MTLWWCGSPGSVTVALLAEGVDRNNYSGGPNAEADVALLAEGVDRNQLSFL